MIRFTRTHFIVRLLMRKLQSTNSENLKKLILLCPISYTISTIGGRWKPLIIDRLLDGSRRYSELKKSMLPITERMLTIQLKEMELDGLLKRIIVEDLPPKVVEYQLTERGISLKNVLKELYEWGSEHNLSQV